MRKHELIAMVMEDIVGKDLSDTDIRVTFVEMLDRYRREDEVTESQAKNWTISKAEWPKLRRATKECSCQFM